MIERPHSTETAVNPNEGERLVRTSHHEGSPIGLSDSGSGRILTFTNESLAYTRHVVLDAQDKPGIEVFLSDELKERMRSVGWKAVRNLFEQDIKDLERDPFGERSIDPDKDSEALRRARSVNGASHALETLLGIPIAIKGSGSGKVKRLTRTRQSSSISSTCGCAPSNCDPNKLPRSYAPSSHHAACMA